MKPWYAAAELVGLPGLPGTIRSIHRLASARGWQSRRREGRGGGNEYHLDSLSPDIRTHLVAAQLRESSDASAHAGQTDAMKLELIHVTERSFGQQEREQSLRATHSLNAGDQARLTARLEIIQLMTDFQRLSGLSVVDAQYRFAEQYNAGAVPMGDETMKLYPQISRGTLARWQSELKRHGPHRLAGRYGNRKGQSKIERQPELVQYLKGAIVTYPHIQARTLFEGMRARFSGRADMVLPGARAVGRWLSVWKRENEQIFTAISNPDRWKSEFMVSHGSISEGITRLNQCWEFDATPADILLIDGRHTLSGIIDVYSRRPKLLVTPTNRAAAVASLVRRALLDWGVPESVRVDNGKEYVGHHLTRVFTSLQIEQKVMPPFQPWKKGHIERFFRTFSHDLVELLPGYCGHNVAERQELRARVSFADRLMQKGESVEIQMSAKDLQDFCDRWCDNLYGRRVHSELGCSPFDRVANWTGEIRRIQDERALDLLLAEAPDNHGWRTVHKRGIRIKWAHEESHHWYIAPELGAWVKQSVMVLYDPAGDMGRIFVFGGEGFVCVAECPELTGIDRQEYAAHGKNKQRAAVQEQRREFKEAAKAANVGSLAEEILAHSEQQHGNVAMFRRAGQAHTTERLSDAAEAIQAAADLDTPAPVTPVSEESLQRVAELIALNDMPQDTAEGRFARAIVLLDDLSSAGDSDLEWLRVYQQSSEFRGRYRAWRSLGEGAARADLEGDPWLTPVQQRMAG